MDFLAYNVHEPLDGGPEHDLADGESQLGEPGGGSVGASADQGDVPVCFETKELRESKRLSLYQEAMHAQGTNNVALAAINFRSILSEPLTVRLHHRRTCDARSPTRPTP